MTNNLFFDAILISKIFKNLENNKNIKISRSEDLLHPSGLDLKHEKKIVERMIAEYDHAHYLNKEKCETFINNKQNYHNIIYQKMKEIKMKDIYKYENFKNQLGSLYNPLSEELPSPYQDLLDTIISEDDDSTKYNNLLLFKDFAMAPAAVSPFILYV